MEEEAHFLLSITRYRVSFVYPRLLGAWDRLRHMIMAIPDLPYHYLKGNTSGVIYFKINGLY